MEVGGRHGTEAASQESNSALEFGSAARELRERVFVSVRALLGDSILLSGGLDTSIVTAVVSAIVGAEKMRNFGAYTVVLDGAPAPDLEFSKLVSRRFHATHMVRKVSHAQLEEALPETIRVLGSFDPMEIRNSVATYVGMKEALLEGRSKIMTGDGSDELFAGYSFIFKLPPEKAEDALAHLWEVMHFSSIPLASSLGMEARLPFLHPIVKEMAFTVGYSMLTGRGPLSDELFGKYILRRAFEDMLPPEVVWRTKTPIEYGSGTTVLPAWYSKSIGDSEFSEAKKRYLDTDGVRLRDKEQLRYYEIYRGIFGPPTTKDADRRSCPACNSNVPDEATFCTTCGEYPI